MDTPAVNSTGDPAGTKRLPPLLFLPKNRPRPNWALGLLFLPSYMLSRGIPLAGVIVLACALLLWAGRSLGIEHWQHLYPEEIAAYWFLGWAACVALAALAWLLKSLPWRLTGMAKAFLVILVPLAYPCYLLPVFFRNLGAALLLMALCFLGVGLHEAAVTPLDLTLPALIALALAGLGGLYTGLVLLYGACWMHSMRTKIAVLRPSTVQHLQPGLVELEGFAQLHASDATPAGSEILLCHAPADPSRDRNAPFYLVDPSGRILVDPRDCMVGEPEELRLARRAEGPEKREQFQLRAGDPLHVLGSVVPAEHTVVQPRMPEDFVLRGIPPPHGLLFGAYHGRAPDRSAWTRAFAPPPNLFLLSNMADPRAKRTLFGEWRWKLAAALVYLALSLLLLGSAIDFLAGEIQCARLRDQIATAPHEEKLQLLLGNLAREQPVLRGAHHELIQAGPTVARKIRAVRGRRHGVELDGDFRLPRGGPGARRSRGQEQRRAQTQREIRTQSAGAVHAFLYGTSPLGRAISYYLPMKIICLVFCLSLLGANLFGEGTEWDSPATATSEAADLFRKGAESVKIGKYEEAVKLFESANGKDKNNPEILNMLAYSKRKLGRLDEALENYGQALKLRPKFPQAREYLGEAHLQALLLQLQTLESYGAEGAKEAEKLKQSLLAAAAKIQKP